jgi:hypothetical protein
VLCVNHNPVVAALADAGERWSDSIAALSASLFKVMNLAANVSHGNGLHSSGGAGMSGSDVEMAGNGVVDTSITISSHEVV